MKRMICILGILMLLIPSAIAAETIDLSTDGCDQLMHDPLVLPDGRVVIAGQAGVKGNYQDSRARLLCLNPDGSIAWDYRHPASGNCSYTYVQLLDNGLLGVIFRNSPNQETKQVEIHKFTTDGKMAGEPIDIFTTHFSSGEATEACIEYAVIDPYAQTFYRYYIDWDGNFLFSIHSDDYTSGGSDMLGAEDGIILYGSDNGYPAPAKIIKLDFYGNLVWETVLPTYLPEASAQLMNGCRTSDGGYVFWLMETAGDLRGEVTRHKALVKFDGNGNLLWINREEPNTETTDFMNSHCNHILEFGDYLVLDMGTRNYDIGQPYHFLWFTKDGKYVGRNEVKTVNRTCVGSEFIQLGDHLYTMIQTRDEKKNIRDEMDTCDVILFPIPMPENQ